MKNISLNDLNQIVKVQKRKVKIDEFGGIIEEWEDLFRVWASVERIDSTSYQIRSKNFEYNFYKVYIRVPKGMSKAIRLILKDKTLIVEKAELVNDNPEFLEIIAYEKVRNGISLKN
jgi:SPP1 family predicted phage head-tail adaptor